LPDQVIEYFSRNTSNDSGVQSGTSCGEPTLIESTNEEPETTAEKLLNDYEDSLKLNFGHRLSILQGNLSEYLNAEYTYEQVAKSIHREKRKNADYSYWSAKLLQKNLGVEDEKNRAQDIVESLEFAARSGHKNAETEVENIKKKYKKGQYASLVRSYTLAKREIVEEKAEMCHFTTKSKNFQKQQSLPFEPVPYGRVSSDPKF